MGFTIGGAEFAWERLGGGSTFQMIYQWRFTMKTKLLSVLSAAVLFGTCGFALAENRTVNKTPGHEMQQKGSFKNDPGASGVCAWPGNAT